MRYRKNWNGMTEIVWDEVMEGNTVRTPEKVIQMENIRPRKAERQRPAKRSPKKKAAGTDREDDLKLLAAQSTVMMAMLIMICLLDGADIPQTIVLMTLIIACSAIMLIISGDEKER